MPTSGKAAASTALPQPPNTSQNVPSNSATERLTIDMCIPAFLLLGGKSRRECAPARDRGQRGGLLVHARRFEVTTAGAGETGDLALRVTHELDPHAERGHEESRRALRPQLLATVIGLRDEPR